MKTITVEFQHPDGTTARAVGTFAAVPGEGPVEWSGNTAPIRKTLPKGGTLQPMGYSFSFADAMRGLAGKCHAHVKITEEGNWEVYEE